MRAALGAGIPRVNRQADNEPDVARRVVADCGVVVLAAGQGRRFGGAKQAALWRKRPLISHVTALALEAVQGRSPVHVVLGAYRARLEAILAPLQRQYANLHVTFNAAWATGLASSLHVAVHSLETRNPSVQAAVFMLADQPCVPPSLIRSLRNRWLEGWDLAASAASERLCGAPALFARSYWPAILALEGDRGARVVLERYASAVALVECEPHWLIDIDRPLDLERPRLRPGE